MGLYDDYSKKAGGADPAGERNNPKPGKVWVIINECAAGVNKNPKGGYVGKVWTKVGCVVLRTFEPGGCQSHGLSETGQPQPKCSGPHAPGDVHDHLFQDGVLQNENRHKAFLMTVFGLEKHQVTGEVFDMCITNAQPMRNIVLEVNTATEATQTDKKKWIHKSSAGRRVAATEVQAVLDQLAPAARAELARDGRLEKMLKQEEGEARAKAASLAAAAAAGQTK